MKTDITACRLDQFTKFFLGLAFLSLLRKRDKVVSVLHASGIRLTLRGNNKRILGTVLQINIVVLVTGTDIKREVCV